jgi:hypothetical protein
VLDFAVETSADPPPLVVSRVRITVGLAFDVLRALNATMTLYEAAWGEIVRPRRRDEEGEVDG